ncbi:hypothetical protein B0H14DRAFT_3124100 [Mycena olivaceomarginata]|nr:hypothetical protein B0H14DRAFT_3124100 [Mycena olivaceomarginata]
MARNLDKKVNVKTYLNGFVCHISSGYWWYSIELASTARARRQGFSVTKGKSPGYGRRSQQRKTIDEGCVAIQSASADGASLRAGLCAEKLYGLSTKGPEKESGPHVFEHTKRAREREVATPPLSFVNVNSGNHSDELEMSRRRGIRDCAVSSVRGPFFAAADIPSPPLNLA